MSKNTKQITKHRFERSDQIKQRKPDRLKGKAAAVLARMKQGQALHLENRWYGAAWCLTGGQYIQDEIAKVVICNANVAAVGEALFQNVPSQTFRWIKN
jgi:hypothetical protein